MLCSVAVRPEAKKAEDHRDIGCQIISHPWKTQVTTICTVPYTVPRIFYSTVKGHSLHWSSELFDPSMRKQLAVAITGWECELRWPNRSTLPSTEVSCVFGDDKSVKGHIALDCYTQLDSLLMQTESSWWHIKQYCRPLPHSELPAAGGHPCRVGVKPATNCRFSHCGCKAWMRKTCRTHKHMISRGAWSCE